MPTQFELKQRINLEKRITRVIVKDCLAAGYSLNVNNGGDENELVQSSIVAKDVLQHMFCSTCS